MKRIVNALALLFHEKSLWSILVVLVLSTNDICAQGVNYDFYSVSPSGDTLYYIKEQYEVDSVYVCAPRHVGTIYNPWYGEYWDGFTRPSGDVVIPDSILHRTMLWGWLDTTIWFYVVGIQDGFVNCTEVTSVTIPDNEYFHYIGSNSFSGCTNLDSIHVGNHVNGIGDEAFKNCSSLQSIFLPNSVTVIGDNTFQNCSSLSRISMSNAILSIGYEAFSNCTSLTSLTIPASVRYLHEHILWGCSSLDTLFFNPDTIIYATNGSLFGGAHLSSLHIGENVKVIPNYSFYGCPYLTHVSLPNSVKHIKERAFSLCTNLHDITLPDSLITLGNYAFSGCSNLQSINIPRPITAIGSNTFVDCSQLTTVYYDADSCYSGYTPFSHNLGLTSVYIGSGVKFLPTLFEFCTNISAIYAAPIIAPTQQFTFNQLSALTPVYIPCGSLSSYSSTWTTLSNFIELSEYSISTSSDNNGIVEIIRDATCTNDSVTFQAIANQGYVFSHWSDGDTTNPRTLVLTQDTSLTAYFIVAPTDCNNISLPYAANFTQCWTTEGGASVIASNRIRLGGHGQKATSPWFTIHDSAGLHLKWTLTKDSVNGTVPENDPNFIRKIKVLADDNNRTMQWDNWWGNTISMSEALGAQYAGQTIQVEFEYIGNDSISFSLTDVTLFQFADTVEVSAPIHAYIGDTIVLAAHVSLPEGNYGPYVPYWNFYTSDWTSVSNNSIGVVNNHADTVVAIFNTPGEYIATFAYTVWNVFNGYPVYSNNREVYISIIDTTVVDTLFDCDSITLPYIADFTQCWTASGGATIIGGNQASINSQGQTLTSPWINVPSGTVYYHFIDRRDTTETYWNSWDSAIWYSVTVEDADGGIVTTANWDSESSSQGKISSFPAPGGPIRFVFTYTDTHAVQLHYIENLEIYAYDMTLTVEGPTSVHVGDTVVYTAHVSMPEGEQPDYWNWTLYDHSYNNVDSSIATVIATTDSTRTIVWHTSGEYRLFTSVQEYIPQTVWQYLYYTITVLDTTTPTPVDCDSITLPYTADFTQCWMAEGAVVIDSNHVSMISVGQKITSPWMESVAGKTFFNYEFLRDGEYTYDYDNEQITVIVENENGVIQRYVEYPAWSYSPWFENPGGRIRISFEYTGRRAVPSCRLSNVSLYQYEIENAIEGPGIVHVGDTVTFTAHATLQDDEMADYYDWYMYVYNSNGSSWVDENDPSRTIVSRTDSTLVVVWNTPGRYSVTSSVYKNNVYHNSNAYASDWMYINVVNFPFYEEDSIYYTSAAKDTVIGCHPDLHVANLPESVTVIFDSAFFNLSNLSIIELPTSLHTIGNMAFAWNQGISEITIPQNVTFVGDNAFWWDTNLTTVNFNATNCQTMSPSTDNNGNYWPVFIGCNNITTINIGENVTRIPDRAFSYCNGLHGTLTIPDAVTYIGRSAFFHWIDDWDWDNGSSWDTLSIVLGTGLTEIGDYAFGCPRAHITSVISHNPEPPIIGEQTFYRYEPEYTPRLQVPCGSAAAYRNAQHWSRIEEIIEDCDGIEDAENDARTPAILSDNGIITVVGATELVSVYDMMGRLVSAYMPTDFRCTIVVPHSGVYMVKIGDCPARKIVVIK